MAEDEERGDDPGPLPGVLDRSRDLELKGRGYHSWVRRGLLLALFSLPVLALLGAFGQKPSTVSAGTAAAELKLTAPDHLRGGLVFQTAFEITAGAQTIERPSLALAEGWFNSVTMNTVAPEPIEQEVEDDVVLWHFDSLAAGESMTVRAQWQVNPTRVGRGDGGVALRDGDRELVAIDREIIFFP